VPSAQSVGRASLAALTRLARPIQSALEDPRDRRARDWIASGHDRTLRLEYDLDEHSVVFDLGGFEGQWASDIFAMYRCRVEVFEPVAAFADRISNRFARNDSIRVHAFGLSDCTQKSTIAVHGDQSSLFHAAVETSSQTGVDLVKASDFFASEGVGQVDLMKVNIEGGEYDLLDHLLDEDLMPTIVDLQVQFHDFVPDAERRMRGIQQKLRATHDPTYQVEFVWENWHRR
jgi:FkbM family methyltransferase